MGEERQTVVSAAAWRSAASDGAGRHEQAVLVVYGCGTQGRAIIEILSESPCPCEFQLTDDNAALWGSVIFSRPVVPPIEAFASAGRRFVCTVGANVQRRAISERLLRAGHAAAAIAHPAAIVSRSASLGAGSLVMARAVVNTEALVGEGCLLNTGCVVEHHCQIGDFAHLAPGVLLGGSVSVGADAFLGLGAVVLPNLTIGRGAVVGAGAVVIRNVPPGATVVGNPARILRPSPPPRQQAAPPALAAQPNG